VEFTSSEELPTTLSILLQGSEVVAPAQFGAGILCSGGSLVRLFVKNANGGTVTIPGPGDPSVSARSAQLGDPLSTGVRRIYQTYYRDPNFLSCPLDFNATNAIAVDWE
jgi:hypothetical protein